MSTHSYIRGAEDHKPVGLHELHNAKFGIVALERAARPPSGPSRMPAQRAQPGSGQSAGASHAHC